MVTWTWTVPKRVWTAAPSYVAAVVVPVVPPELLLEPLEPVVPELEDPELEEPELEEPELDVVPELLPLPPVPLPPVLLEPVPLEPVLLLRLVVVVVVPVSAMWAPDCQPASRMPAEAAAVASAARILTSRTFRSGVVLRELPRIERPG